MARLSAIAARDLASDLLSVNPAQLSLGRSGPQMCRAGVVLD
jgi:hypothetical protein